MKLSIAPILNKVKFRKTYLVLTFVFLASCAPKYSSTIVGGEYDKSKNQTDYFVLPYGSVSIPGKWEKTSYNQSSRQQFFKNSDSIVIAISFTPINKYEFNADNSKKGFAFTEAIYKWDSDYFVSNYRLSQEKLDSDSVNNYIIWRAFGENNNIIWDSYFLFGEKNGFVRNFSIMKTQAWTKEQKLKFLRELYISSK